MREVKARSSNRIHIGGDAGRSTATTMLSDRLFNVDSVVTGGVGVGGNDEKRYYVATSTAGTASFVNVVAASPTVERRNYGGDGSGGGGGGARGVAEESHGGYDLEFVQATMDRRYTCPICMLIMRDPIQTRCGHRFCDSCLRYWIS